VGSRAGGTARAAASGKGVAGRISLMSPIDFSTLVPAPGDVTDPHELPVSQHAIDEVLVKAEIPGVTKDDLEVSVDESTVTIKGQTSHEEKEEKGDYYRSEIRRGAFSRTIALPREVDASKAKATFKDGILELSLPKVAKSKRVAVKVE
jgi:HSP20 family molecular chaperone IbpA